MRFGEEGAARLRHSCHEPAGLDRLSGAMLESNANIHCAKRNRLGPERAAKLTCVHYNMRLRQAREDPTFEPVCLPQMVLDPIDAEADDFDEPE